MFCLVCERDAGYYEPTRGDAAADLERWSVTELLPTGTVTLLLADVEGSTRLWETKPEQMGAALAVLNRTVDETVAAHGGVRPLEQGEGDSFVTAFARASDAVACALALQRAPLAPIRLRIGVHTGEVQLSRACGFCSSWVGSMPRAGSWCV